MEHAPCAPATNTLPLALALAGSLTLSRDGADQANACSGNGFAEMVHDL